ncbi:MAG TPA: hypothetical protein PLM85_09600 [Nitrosomonas sp.]|nr:hypothetical protein [Nitrosomonas sp.]
MPQSEVIGARGLFINPSLYVNMPAGAMSLANNVYIDRDYLLTSRRGFNISTLSTSSYTPIWNFFYFNGYLLALNETSIFSYDGSVWTRLNLNYSQNNVTGNLYARVLGTGNKNYYIPLDNNVKITQSLTRPVYKLENYNARSTSVPKPGLAMYQPAGLPQVMNVNVLTLNAVSTPLWFTNNSTVAYRAIYGYKDSNNNVIISGVTGRCVVTNSAGASRAPNVLVQIPGNGGTGPISGNGYSFGPSLKTGYHFIQIYRSEMVTSPAIPSDNLKLVYESSISDTDLANNSVSVTDLVAPGLEGVPLYTNSDQEGIVANNAPIPFATKVSPYKTMMMYSSFRTLSTASIQLLAIGGTSGIAVNDRLRFIINELSVNEYGGLSSLIGDKRDMYLEARNATNVGAQQWDINTASTAAGIEYSMNQLCYVLNTGNWGSVIQAKYISEINSLPGQVQFYCKYNFFIVANTTTAASAFGFTRGPFVKIVLGAGTVNTTNGNFTSAAHGFRTGDTVCVFWDEPTDVTGTTPGGGVIDPINNITYYAILIDANNFRLANSPANAFAGTALVPTSTGSGTLTFAKPIVSSNNIIYPNCVAPSKTGRSEEIAEVYAFGGLPVGEANFDIINQIQLRDTFFVFKEDGLWTMNGDTPNDLRIQQFDPTCKLTARGSVAILNNSIFCLTRLGVVRVTENGVQIVSNQIRDAIAEINTSLTVATSTRISGFLYDQGVQGFAYESENKYYLFIPSAVNTTYGDKWFVYNTLTDTWTTMDKGTYTGIVNPNDNKIYLNAPDGFFQKNFYIERKSGDYTDYIDEDVAVTINSVSGTTVALASATGVSVGDVLWQSATIWTYITAISGNDLTTLGEPGFTAGSRTLKKHFTQSIEYFPIHLGAPGLLKNFRDCTVNLQGSLFYKCDYSFKTDLSNSYSVTTLESDSWMIGGFGLSPWGAGPFGGDNVTFSQSPRILFPRDKARATYIAPKMTVDWGYSKMNFAGLSVNYEIVSERTRR